MPALHQDDDSLSSYLAVVRVNLAVVRVNLAVVRVNLAVVRVNLAQGRTPQGCRVP